MFKLNTQTNIRVLRQTTLGVVMCILSNGASALGWFSRACEIGGTLIPNPLFVFASCQLNAAGCWALESVTAEYGARNAWLHATAQTYSRGATDLIFTAERVFSSGWKVDPSEKDSTFGDSGYFFRARAGTGSPTSFFVQLDPNRKYAVIGEHKTFNPVTNVTKTESRTLAYDCNIADLGVGIYKGAWYDGPIPPPVR